MTVNLFPRLDALSVEQCLTDLDMLVQDAGRPLTEDRLPSATGLTAIGGAQVSMAILGELRALVLSVASECGFPDKGNVQDRARFDFLATQALAHFAPLNSGEADRDDVWAFIATILLPDVAAWRFRGRSSSRFLGGVRNTFQRLWMRAWALDLGFEAGSDRWMHLETMTEDALVQLTERPSLGADRRISLAIGKAWAETAERIGKPRMEDVMRAAIINLRIRNEIQFLGALDELQLQEHVSAIFARAAGLEVSEDVRPTVKEENWTKAEPKHVETAVLNDETDERQPEAKTGELPIQHEILKLMLDREIWSNAKLKTELAVILPLTKADRGVGARPAEELWENRVNNALGRARSSSLYAKGFVENQGVGLHSITDRGVAYISDDPDLNPV